MSVSEDYGREDRTPISVLRLPTVVVDFRAGTDRSVGDEGIGNTRVLLIIPIRDGVVPNNGRRLLRNKSHGVQ